MCANCISLPPMGHTLVQSLHATHSASLIIGYKKPSAFSCIDIAFLGQMLTQAVQPQHRASFSYNITLLILTGSFPLMHKAPCKLLQLVGKRIFHNIFIHNKFNAVSVIVAPKLLPFRLVAVGMIKGRLVNAV